VQNPVNEPPASIPIVQVDAVAVDKLRKKASPILVKFAVVMLVTLEDNANVRLFMPTFVMFAVTPDADTPSTR